MTNPTGPLLAAWVNGEKIAWCDGVFQGDNGVCAYVRRMVKRGAVVEAPRGLVERDGTMLGRSPPSGLIPLVGCRSSPAPSACTCFSTRRPRRKAASGKMSRPWEWAQGLVSRTSGSLAEACSWVAFSRTAQS